MTDLQPAALRLQLVPQDTEAIQEGRADRRRHDAVRAIKLSCSDAPLRKSPVLLSFERDLCRVRISRLGNQVAGLDVFISFVELCLRPTTITNHLSPLRTASSVQPDEADKHSGRHVSLMSSLITAGLSLPESGKDSTR